MNVVEDFTPRWLKFVLEKALDLYETICNIYRQNWAFFHVEAY